MIQIGTSNVAPLFSYTAVLVLVRQPGSKAETGNESPFNARTGLIYSLTKSGNFGSHARGSSGIRSFHDSG